jgi:hypothetical protein
LAATRAANRVASTTRSPSARSARPPARVPPRDEAAAERVARADGVDDRDLRVLHRDLAVGGHDEGALSPAGQQHDRRPVVGQGPRGRRRGAIGIQPCEIVLRDLDDVASHR